MDINKEKYTFDDFKEIIAELRSENGCPWDKEQTHESLRKNLIEESYEFIQEVDNSSQEGMREELGDVLLQVLLHSQIASDEGNFTIDDVISSTCSSLSTEQGPAIIAKWPPPILMPPTSTIVLSAWNLRLAFLYGS